MGLFGWLERKVFLGEVVKEYGLLAESYSGISRQRTSLLLCRRSGQLKIIFRKTAVAPLGVKGSYVEISATPETLATIYQIVVDAHAELGRSLPRT